MPASTNTRIATCIQIQWRGTATKASGPPVYRPSRWRERLNPALKAVSDAVLAVAANLSVDEVLQKLVDAARELAGARYAALGHPGRRGRLPPLPRRRDERRADRRRWGRCRAPTGCSARCSSERDAYRTDDIHDDPRFRGWWPRRHPDMRSVPRRPDRLARRNDHRRVLPDREGGRRRRSTPRIRS